MNIQDAALSLFEHLNKDEGTNVFDIYVSNETIVINVNFIYRLSEVQEIVIWEGFPVTIGRRSCW